MVRLKRFYDAPAASDGFRVLVDRLWPRGVKKETAAIDLWLKEIAPSPDLRRWFGHDPEWFDEFADRYKEELRHNPAVNQLKDLVGSHKNVTLLYAAKDESINHAVILKDFFDRA